MGTKPSNLKSLSQLSMKRGLHRWSDSPGVIPQRTALLILHGWAQLPAQVVL